MKTEIEIQKAHDLLSAAIIDYDVKDAMPPEYYAKLAACARVLCWVLGHGQGAGFDALLEHMHTMYEEVPNNPQSQHGGDDRPFGDVRSVDFKPSN